MKAFTIFLGLLMAVSTSAQDISIKAELYKDTVGYEETIRVTFTIKNAQNVDFKAPTFESFEQAAQCGTSMNSSFINGKMSQSVAYSYTLTHFGQGTYSIEAASIEVNGATYRSKELVVVVSDKATTPNPKQEDDFGFGDFRTNPFGDWNRHFEFKTPQIPKQKEQPKEDNPSKTSKRKKVYKM